MASAEQKLQAARLGNFAGTTGTVPQNTGLKKKDTNELLGIVKQAKVAAEQRKVAPLKAGRKSRRSKMRKQRRTRKHRRN
jgi:hypothetical protein